MTESIRQDEDLAVERGLAAGKAGGHDATGCCAGTVALIGTPNDLAHLRVYENPIDPQDDFESAALPFVVLSQSGRFSTVYKAGLFDSSGRLIAPYALKVQRLDALMPDARPGVPPATGARVDADWRDRMEAVRRCGSEIGGLNGIDVEEKESPGGGRCIGPRLFCKHRRLFFRPRSPDSLTVLETCRDDPLLAEHGLPTYSQSHHRFLFSPEDARRGKIRFFSDRAHLRESSDVVVGGEEDCFRSQGRALEMKSELIESQPELHRELLRELPCYDCSEAGRCYPPGEAYPRVLDRLVTFSFYDFHACAFDLYDLQFDDFADLIGGRPIAPWVSSLRTGSRSAISGHLVQTLERLRLAPRLFLFDGSASRSAVLEVLVLKWALLTRTAEQVRALHLHGGRPHLHLSARHALVRFPKTVRSSPLCWNFEVGLIGLDGARSTTIYDRLPGAIFQPPATPEPAYASPALMLGASEFGRWGRASVTVTEVEQELDDADCVRFSGKLVDRALPTRSLPVRGAMRVHFPRVDGTDRFAAWCIPVGQPEHEEIEFEGIAEDQKVKIDLALYVAKELPDLHYEYYPHYGLSDDLYALGVLLLRALLVNERQSLPEVLADVASVLGALERPAGGMDVTRQNLRVIESVTRASRWHSKNLFYRQVGDPSDWCSVIPEPLWHRILLAGFELLNQGQDPGFLGLDSDSSAQLDTIDKVVSTFQEIEREIEREMLPMTPGTGEVGRTLKAVLGQVEGAGGEEPGSAEFETGD